MKEYLEYKDYKSHKFWQIEVNNNEFTVLYGKIGTEGRAQTKTFKDHNEALKEAQKIMAQKIKKGYMKMAEASATEYKIGDEVDATKSYKFFQDYDATEGNIIDQLKSFIQQENHDKVTKIVIDMWEYDTTPADILTFFIENKSSFKNVKHFYIGDIESEENEMSWINQTNYEAFLKEYSTIEVLDLRGGMGLKLGNINMPYLKKLRIETGGMDVDIIKDLAASKQNLLNLEHLELWLGTDEYGGNVTIEAIKDLLSGNPFPKLKYLGLMNYDLQDDVVALFENNPILDRIETLDLSMGILTKKGGESLLSNEKLQNLKSLNCEYNFMPEPMIEELSKKFKNGSFGRGNAYIDEDDDEEYFYVEIGE